MLTAMQNGSDDRRRLAAVVGVGMIHVALIAAFALGRRDLPSEAFQPPPFDILMMRLPPTPSPIDTQAGGGAPATASRIHRAFDPPVEKVEALAPLVQAPLAALEVGVAAVPTVEPGMGLGGDGTGQGEGAGEGDGAGAGRGTGPVLVSGPKDAVITANVSAASLRTLPGSYAVLQCYIRVGRDRLEGCRVKEEHPSGEGVGRAALRKAEEFRYRAPSRVGRFSGRHRQVIAVAFPPATPPVGGGDGGAR